MSIPSNQSDLFAWLATRKSDARLDVRIPAELLEAVNKRASESGMSLSWTVKAILAAGLAKSHKRCNTKGEKI